MRVGDGQREMETQNLKQAPGSQAVSTEPDVGLEFTTMRSQPEPKSDTQLTEPPSCP